MRHGLILATGLWLLVFGWVLFSRPAVARNPTDILGEIENRLGPVGRVYNKDNLFEENTQAILIIQTATVVRIFLGFLGIIFVILIIYGGYLWLTSAGNEQRVEQAQQVLRTAIIGVLIILAAYALSSFVLTEILKATVGD